MSMALLIFANNYNNISQIWMENNSFTGLCIQLLFFNSWYHIQYLPHINQQYLKFYMPELWLITWWPLSHLMLGAGKPSTWQRSVTDVPLRTTTGLSSTSTVGGAAEIKMLCNILNNILHYSINKYVTYIYKQFNPSLHYHSNQCWWDMQTNWILSWKTIRE